MKFVLLVPEKDKRSILNSKFPSRKVKQTCLKLNAKIPHLTIV